MLRLRKILLCDFIYYLIFLISVILVIINIKNLENKYKDNIDSYNGIVTKIKIDGNYLELEVKNKVKVLGTYYFKSLEEKENFNIKLGDKVKIEGVSKEIMPNTNFYLFNYREYLASKKIFNMIEISSMTKLKSNNNIIYDLKEKLISYISKRANKDYLKAFILGDTSELDYFVKRRYQILGVSHLFAISGMHISIFTLVILFVLKKLKFKETFRYMVTIIFLFIYMFITSFSPSVLRSGIFFIILTINKINYFYIKPLNCLLLTISIILLFNPYIIYNIGFIYSSVISFSLVFMQEKIKNIKGYFKSLFLISLISFLVSFPITINNYFSINILSPIYNLVFVPLVSILIFPLTMLNLFIPFLDGILKTLITLLESLSFIFFKIDSNLIFPKVNIWVIIFYYFLIILILTREKRIFFTILFIIVVIIHININSFLNKSLLMMIDVGQGDSILFYSNNEVCLVDTGGKESFYEEEWKKRHNKSTIAYNTLEVILKSLGIRKIDRLILTHGDMDHLGEVISLIDIVDIKKVYFNLGTINSNEEKIIRKLKKNEIDYSFSYENLNFKVGKFKFYQLNKEFLDENDSSSIYLVTKDKFKVLLMGDASIKSEEYLLRKIDKLDIDVLKVGHHGSRTSSSLDFLVKISPEIALISSGKNNRFNHPHWEVINLLTRQNVSIYNTQLVGAIKINFKKRVTISTVYQ